jgi:phosphoribosylaminoimidazolecarboxamide formyltransferase/IMP cyclohydrolase
VRQFDAPACVIVKHANPCGVAVGAAGRFLRTRLRHRSDVGLRRHHRVQHEARCATAKAILDRQFVEVLIAPDYEDGALEYARKKANVRVLRIRRRIRQAGFIDVKRVGSGLLMQTADTARSSRRLKVVTKLAPTDAQFADLLFAWKVAKFVKSNAIVYAKDAHHRHRRRADEPRLARASPASRPPTPGWRWKAP